MRLLVLFAVLFVAACGGGAEGPAGEPGAAPRPEGPPPVPVEDVGSAPPPAWVETEQGSFWLGYGSYCWETVCVDFVEPECGTPSAPAIPVRLGETVTFHLDFDPEELVVGERRLEAVRSPTWEVDRGGLVSLFADAKDEGDASYWACLEPADGEEPSAGAPAPGGGLSVSEALDAETDQPLLVRGQLHVREGEVRLCQALAESFPPQCAGLSLLVRGADLSRFELASGEGVRWSEGEVSLLGTVEDGVLTVSKTAMP